MRHSGTQTARALTPGVPRKSTAQRAGRDASQGCDLFCPAASWGSRKQDRHGLSGRLRFESRGHYLLWLGMGTVIGGRAAATVEIEIPGQAAGSLGPVFAGY